ncbi:MAG: asparagine synthase (glutamine-hydrolyzing) [Bacteroidia bacterium]|nr:asparagine synthase (glutamine-hydrolyzing) [Bacteroidia bacterium]
MCGINLIIDHSSQTGTPSIRSMNRRLAHRGPDGDGFFTQVFPDKICHFGHTRLKIIDTGDRNHQPFRSACGRYVLTYNGEIYNFEQIKRDLIREKVEFHTSGDTEVLLQLLIREKEKALSRLEGMFAFAFMDIEQDYILLARDPFGMKPLYFSGNGPCWIASSEIRGILASGLINPKLNPACLPHYLRYKFAPKTQTFFEGISELPEGHAICIQHNKTEIFDYRKPALPETSDRSDKENLNQLHTLLQESVKNHLIADVPVGLFLSGGVDSTLLLALIREQGLRKFPAFVMGNHPGEGSFGTHDYHFARRAAQKYEADLVEIPVESGILNHLPEFVESLDQPIADGGGLLTFLLSKTVGTKAKVALSGAGADELFAGYNRHQAFHFYLKNQQLLTLSLPLLRATAHILPTGFDHPFRKSFRLIRKFAQDLNPNAEKTFRNFCGLHFPETESHFSTSFTLDQALHYERENYLISDILMMTDATSMRHSLEVRMPYLTPPLLQFSQDRGGDYLLKGGRKWLLKHLLETLGGQEFCKRPKEGFGMPIGKWIREPENSHWLEFLRNSRHPVFEWVDPAVFTDLLERHIRRKADYTSEITAMLILMIWINANFPT